MNPLATPTSALRARRAARNASQAVEVGAGAVAGLRGPWCAECGHRFAEHGDRSTGACAGDYTPTATHTRAGAPGPLCRCSGWVRGVDEMRESA